MKNPITTLHIQNFKTIKDLKVNCKRINIIIGKPNVGKSNFLEALSLLGATYSTTKEKFLGEFIRYNKFEDLFYDKETSKEILVSSNISHALVNRYEENLFYFQLLEYEYTLDKEKIKKQKFIERHTNDHFGLKINRIGNHHAKLMMDMGNPIKKYEFQKGIDSTNRSHDFLLPPHGENIFTILNRNKSLLKEIGGFFKEYKLKFGLRMADTSFEVIKQVGNYIYSTSYNLIADTLQRMIFNIAAIESNKESILLFEEPEAHSFPPYIKLFAEKVIESKTNQFFINTHSPFILNTIIENTPLEEVAVFVASYEKYQTKMTELTRSELEKMLNHGNDIFFSSRLMD